MKRDGFIIAACAIVGVLSLAFFMVFFADKQGTPLEQTSTVSFTQEQMATGSNAQGTTEIASRLTELPKTQVEDFDNINLDISYAEVELLQSENNNCYLQYCLYGDLTEYKVEQDTLVLKERKSNGIYFSLSPNDKETYVKLYLPADKEFENVEIDNASGDISFGNLLGKTITLDASSGQITIASLQADDLTINDSYGDVEVKKYSVQKGDFELSSGNVVLGQAKWTSLKIDDNYGDITIEHQNEGKIEYDLHTNYGEICIDGATIMNGDDEAKKYKTSASGKINLTVDCASGNIEVK